VYRQNRRGEAGWRKGSLTLASKQKQKESKKRPEIGKRFDEKILSHVALKRGGGGSRQSL
jgi:hypothetical protein